MAGNILTNPAATYSTITLLSTTKVDTTVRTDAESDEYAIANWFTEIDAAVIKINAFLVGSQSAGIAGNTTTLLGALAVVQALSAASAALTGALTAATVTATGAIAGASVAATAAVTGATMTATGAIAGLSVAATNGVTAATVNATGNVDGKVVHVMVSYFSSTVTTLTYMPIDGLTESGTITTYTCAWIAPYDGEIIKVLIRTSGNGGSTLIGMHKNDNTTPSCSQTVSVGAGGTATTFASWTGTTTFSKTDRLHFGYTPAASPTNVQVTIVLRLNTNT